MQDGMAPERAKSRAVTIWAWCLGWIGKARGDSCATTEGGEDTSGLVGVTPSRGGAGFTGRRPRTWRFWVEKS